MSRLEIFERMASGYRLDIRAMENEVPNLDMSKHPYFTETLANAKADLTECEKQIEAINGE